MLKKFWIHFLAIVFVISFLVVGSTQQVEAAKLQSQANTKIHTAVIVVEDFSQKEVVKVIDATGIRKMSGAIKWIEDNAEGRNLRFVSTDAELLDSWKQATAEAGYKVKNPEVNYSKISDKANKTLKRGTKYSFEIKNIKSKGNNDLEKGISYVMAAAGLISAFK